MATITSVVRPELCGQEEDDEEEIDPRIRVELESLNQAAGDVNCLEKEINEARTKYQVTFSECSVELETLKNKHGTKIKRARPYYEIKEQAKEAQSEAIRSARKFQSANSVYLAAKETISLAELRLMDDKAANLSTAWQEMLNHAVLRVMEAEQEKSRNEKEHLEKAAVFAQLEKKMHFMEKKFKKSIEKAKSYFDSKNELELKLQQIKQTIEDFQQAMQSAKLRYSNSLKRLETISDGIHEIRRKRLMLMYPREPGVGAEEENEENVKELPTLESSCFDDSEKCSLEEEDENLEEESEDDNCSEIDEMNSESKFRHKVLTCPLDSEESVFTRPKTRVQRRRLIKSQSLPSHLGEEASCEDISSEFYCSNKLDVSDDSGNDLMQAFDSPSHLPENQRVSQKYEKNIDTVSAIVDGLQRTSLRPSVEGKVSDVADLNC